LKQNYLSLLLLLGFFSGFTPLAHSADGSFGSWAVGMGQVKARQIESKLQEITKHKESIFKTIQTVIEQNYSVKPQNLRTPDGKTPLKLISADMDKAVFGIFFEIGLQTYHCMISLNSDQQTLTLEKCTSAAVAIPFKDEKLK
jgi:hypothetical protein